MDRDRICEERLGDKLETAGEEGVRLREESVGGAGEGVNPEAEVDRERTCEESEGVRLREERAGGGAVVEDGVRLNEESVGGGAVVEDGVRLNEESVGGGAVVEEGVRLNEERADVGAGVVEEEEGDIGETVLQGTGALVR